MTSFHDFATRMRADLSRWRREAAAAELDGFFDIAQTIRQWIAEGESLIAPPGR